MTCQMHPMMECTSRGFFLKQLGKVPPPTSPGPLNPVQELDGSSGLHREFPPFTCLDRWDQRHKKLRTPNVGEMMSLMPVIHFNCMAHYSAVDLHDYQVDWLRVETIESVPPG
jgi:hypothetical protein